MLVKGPYVKFLQDAEKAAEQKQSEEDKQWKKEQKEKKKERKERKREKQRKRQAEEEQQKVVLAEEKAARLKAEEEEQIRNQQIKERRALQHKLAGHPSAKHLWFEQMHISEHAHFRWHDRQISGTEVATLKEFLQQIDEGRILYRLQPLSDNRWEVKIVSKSYHGQKEELVLLLNKSKTTIITILRDDKTYNHKKDDHEYAPSGKISKEKTCMMD